MRVALCLAFWLMLLFVEKRLERVTALQEFSFPDAVRLWDTLFSDAGGRTDCLLRICVAMLLNIRGELLQVSLVQF